MPNRIRVFPYKQGSKSALALAEALGGKVLKLQGSAYVPAQGDTIINWGASQCPFIHATPAQLVNSPEAIRLASNKRDAFAVLAAGFVSIPSYATAKDGVSWEGATVVRHKLTGHSGEGIEIVEPNLPLPDAPLYVQYIKKEQEYRVHIVGGSITVVQRKARRLEVPDAEVNWQVRNHHNGFLFVRNGDGGGPVVAPEQVLEQSKLAVAAIGLDFGAVDVIWNAASQQAYVLEVNTAPGLEGTTVTDYATAFRALIEGD